MKLINIKNKSVNSQESDNSSPALDLNEDQKNQLNGYRQISERFGLHPIKIGTKAPKDTGWNNGCLEKRAYLEEDFIEIMPNGRPVVLNAGIACGPANGIIVLDVDSQEGFEQYCSKSNIELPLEETLTIASGGKSLHHYYEFPNDGKHYGNKSIGGVFDIRGLGGQVIAPGSIHYETGVAYTIRNDVPMLPAPAWLLELALKQDKDPAEESKRRDTSQNKEDVGPIYQGSRNNTLASLTGKMHAGRFSYDAILAAMEQENKNRCSPPLDQKDVVNIVKGITTRYPAGTSGSVFNLTDMGNAERLISLFGKDIRYCSEEKRWYVWNGEIWQQRNKTVSIIDFAKKTTRSIYKEAATIQDLEKRNKIVSHALRSESNFSLKALVELAASDQSISISPDQFDANPFALNTLNGTIDLKTGILNPHRREDLIRTMIPVEYDPHANCLEFKQFVFSIMNTYYKMMEYLQKIIGYALTGDTGEQVYFLLYGTGSNGKSTLLNVISKLMGSFAKTISFNSLTYFGDKARTDLARLVGTRLVTCSEINRNKINEGVVNRLTGGDPLTAKFLYGDEFQYVPVFKLFIAGNDRPNIEGSNHGTWRRIRLIPFEVRFDEKNGRINNLEQTLFQELPGILNWAVEGCLLWQKEGLDPPALVKQATSSYETESNVFQIFLDETCTLDPNEDTVTSQLYARFVAWCRSEGHEPLKKSTFRDRMKEKGFQKQRKKGQDWWIGIRKRKESDPEPPVDLAPEPFEEEEEEHKYMNLL